MEHMFSVLPKVLSRRGLQAHAEGALIVLRAQRWIDGRLPQLLGMIRVEKYKENTLCIACTHSIAAQECQALLPDLVEFVRLNCPIHGVFQVRIGRR
jgi:hypothetical protein